MDIIASIGPTLETHDDILKAVEKGATIFRVALGYRSRDNYNLIKIIKETEKQLGSNVSILLDFPSSRPRINSSWNLHLSEKIVFRITKFPMEKNDNTISIDNYDEFIQNINIGSEISFLDGKLKAKIQAITEESIELLCFEGDSLLKSGNSLSLLSGHYEYKLLVREDLEFLESLNNSNINIDFIAFSFSQNKSQVEFAKEQVLSRLSSPPKIIAKIETRESVYQFRDISSVVDGFMIARGDLAVSLEFSPLVAEVQNEIVNFCREKDLYSIIATELLENYTDTGILSRSEISDLSLSISQFPNALQLGKETVYSQRPFESISMLKKFIDYESFRYELNKIKLPKQKKYNNTKNIIIAIEGANGAGKTTLCKGLVNHFNIPFKFGVPDVLLTKSLKEKMIIDAHWYSSSLFFISGAIEQIREIHSTTENLVILDRSLWSTFSVHAVDNPNKLKPLIDLSYVVDDIQIEPDYTVILRASYSTCRERISKKTMDEQKLDELVNFKEFYQKEEQFYNWLGYQRDNIIHIDVNDISEKNLLEKVIEVIDRLEKDN